MAPVASTQSTQARSCQHRVNGAEIQSELKVLPGRAGNSSQLPPKPSLCCTTASAPTHVGVTDLYPSRQPRDTFCQASWEAGRMPEERSSRAQDEAARDK